MKKLTITLNRESTKQTEYLLQHTHANSLNSLIEILLDFSYTVVRKKGKLL